MLTQVEEKELDANKVQQAMTNIATSHKAELAVQRYFLFFSQYNSVLYPPFPSFPMTTHPT